MNRREFIGKLGLGLAAGWTVGHLCWPVSVGPANKPISLALLADAHLPDGDPGRSEARALARTVAEIRALAPAPHLVLFAGDLAHSGNPEALALGEEILSDLPMPVLAVRGEGDGTPEKGEAGWHFFDSGRFSYTYAGVNLLGLDTAYQNTPHGPDFALGEVQHRWLAAVLTRLDPAAPLVILSHAPLSPIYRPWGQWTRDSGPLIDRLSRFENVLYLHGHVHHCDLIAGKNLNVSGQDNWFFRKLKTGNRKPSSHLALPATSWPLPSPLEGTPRKLHPGLGPRGCGWALLHQVGQQSQFRQVLWQT